MEMGTLIIETISKRTNVCFQAFAGRYCECNRGAMTEFRNVDTVFVLAFAIVMLNTDLHSPSIKHDKRMKLGWLIQPAF